jgi:hypothetical protein
LYIFVSKQFKNINKMGSHGHHEEESKGSIVDQMFDETISGGAMFYTICALVVVSLVLIGVIS